MGKRMVLWGVCMAFAAVCRGEAVAEKAAEQGQADAPVLSPLAQRAEKVNEAFRLERSLRGAWMNPKYTSEEIEALRKRLKELQKEQEEVLAELREKVNAIPEVQAVRMQIKLLHAEAKALEEQAKASERPAKASERPADRPAAAPQDKKETK